MRKSGTEPSQGGSAPVRGGFARGRSGLSCTLTIFFDGQFWAGIAEQLEDGRLSACRIVFGAEPSNEEVLRRVVLRWDRLRFSESIPEEAPSLPSNPKRRQREAARTMQERGPSTKAQQAISQQRESDAHTREEAARQQREQESEERYRQRQEKRKQKHRGR